MRTISDMPEELHVRRKNARRWWFLLTSTLLICASLVAGIFLVGTISNTSALGLKLALSDDFTKTGLDTTKWTALNSPVKASGERAVYSATNVIAGQGLLILRSEKRAVLGSSYVSGAVSTAKKLTFTYGTVEIRAKLPKGKGLGTTFRLIGADCAASLPDVRGCSSWPTAGSEEIDILEAKGQDPSSIALKSHSSPTAGQDKSQRCVYFGPDFSANYHIFSLSWTATQIAWSVDGVQRCLKTTAIPSKPMFLELGTAVGGPSVGDPNATTPFPQYTLLDYVRVSAQTLPASATSTPTSAPAGATSTANSSSTSIPVPDSSPVAIPTVDPSLFAVPTVDSSSTDGSSGNASSGGFCLFGLC